MSFVSIVFMGITRQEVGPVTLAPSDSIIHIHVVTIAWSSFFSTTFSFNHSTHVLTTKFQLFYFPADIGSINPIPMHPPHPLLTPHFPIPQFLYAQLPFNFQSCLSPLLYLLLLRWVFTHFGHTVLVQLQYDRSRQCHCHFRNLELN